MSMKCLDAVLRLHGFLHLASLRQERKSANVLVFTGQCLDMNFWGRFEGNWSGNAVHVLIHQWSNLSIENPRSEIEICSGQIFRCQRNMRFCLLDHLTLAGGCFSLSFFSSWYYTTFWRRYILGYKFLWIPFYWSCPCSERCPTTAKESDFLLFFGHPSKGRFAEERKTCHACDFLDVRRRLPIFFDHSKVSTCSKGEDCGYCHMWHPQRPVHLDKRQRR